MQAWSHLPPGLEVTSRHDKHPPVHAGDVCVVVEAGHLELVPSVLEDG
jgi:hypothetical protein